MTISKKKSKVILMYIMQEIILLIMFVLNDYQNIGNLMPIAWTANIIYILYVAYSFYIQKEILSFDIIFMSFIFLFCNGQVLLYSLGINMEKSLVFYSNSTEEIMRATVYFLLSFSLMGLGMLATLKEKEKEEEYVCTDDFNKAIKNIAIILFVVSCGAYFYNLIPKLLVSITKGYSALYDVQEGTSTLAYIKNFFIPSMLLLLYVDRKDKKMRMVWTTLCLIIAGAGLILGGRGEAISIIVILTVYYNRYIKKIEGINLIKLLVLILIVSIIIPTVAAYRSNRENGIKTVVLDVFNNDNSPVIQTVAELGATMNAWCLTDRAVPSLQDFKYGESYLASFGMVVPSVFLGGYSFANKAALDIWLQDIWDMSYGPGFNIFAETYYNFGWSGGIAFALVLGVFFGKMFNLRNKDKQRNELLKILSLVFLFNSLIIARFPFHSTIRNIFYMYILIYIMIILLYNYKIKRRIS